MRGLFATARDAVRTQLWPIPAAAVVLAVLAGYLVPKLDVRVDDDLPAWLSSAVFGGDAGAARSVLGAVSSSLITVTSLTFSLTVVTLQLASSQFSPRLLRTFTRDLFVQATLAVFLATFGFSLTVLRSVRSADGPVAASVPRLAVTAAFVLAVVSVLALVFFLAHLATQIRVETMLRNVHREATRTMRSVLEVRRPGDVAGAPPGPPGSTVVLRAGTSGFLTWFAEADLLNAAVASGAVIELDVDPGTFLVERVPVGRAWSVDGSPLLAGVAERLVPTVQECIHTGPEPTAGQDVGFGLRQLTDVAVKALSPGINDPTTAEHALGHMSALLCDLAERDLGPRLLRHEGAVRVILRRPDFAQLLESALTQPRRYGAGDPLVLGRLYRLLTDLAFRVPDDLRPQVDRQLARLRSTVAAADLDATERGVLADLDTAARAALSEPAS